MTGQTVSIASQAADATAGQWRHLRWWLLAFVVLGLLVRTVHVADGIGGDHVFRQAHVANEILSLKSEQPAPALKPFEWFNRGFGNGAKIYDTPVFQYTAAKLSDLSGLDQVAAAKLLNLIVYVLTGWVLVLVFGKLAETPVVWLTAIYVFVVSPLSIHFFSAVLPDNLPILLSLAALYWFLRYEESGETRYWNVSLASALFSAAIKPPVFFTMAIALAFHRLRDFGWRDLFRGRVFVFFAAVGLVVVAYSLTMAYINWGTLRDPNSSWYFGSLTQRLQGHWWKPFLTRLGKEFGSPLFFLFFLYGLYRWLRHGGGRYRSVVTGWLLGAAVTVLVFFNVNSIHNYYQLPFIPVYALMVGYGGAGAVAWLSARLPGVLRYAGLALFTALAVGWAFNGARVMNYSAVKGLEQEAAFVRANTPADGFVLWQDCGDAPENHYFARRRGFCLEPAATDDAAVRRIAGRYNGGALDNLFVFAAKDAVSRMRDAGVALQPVAVFGAAGQMALYRYAPVVQ